MGASASTFERDTTMRYFPIVFILFLLTFSPPASAKDMNFPASNDVKAPAASPLPKIEFLEPNDARALEGNAIFENASRRLEKELYALADGFARELRHSVRIAFDDSQMDWLVYFHIEVMAFKPSDAWSREVPLKGSKGDYENLYQQNILFALSFRTEQVEKFRSEIAALRKNETYKTILLPRPETVWDEITAPRYDEEREKFLLREIEEAQYRVNVWTHESLRNRLYRAEEAWKTYRASMARYGEALGWDKTRVREQDFLLLEYRLALLLKQKEALFRVKTETEDL